ncbi:MAG: dihydrodipicolinate synthase family protein [Anaerolineae bacterium]
MSLDLQGIFVPLATPFDEQGQLNEPELRRLLRRLAPYVDGFVPNGTTGDFPLLSTSERQRILEIVVDETGEEKWIIAGIGAIATRETVSLAKSAHQTGADAVLAVKPYYVRPTRAGLRDHFLTIAESVPDVPVLLYNFPKLMGQEIPVDVVSELTDRAANVVGMKDSSGQLPYTLSIIEATPAAFNVLVGHGALLLPAVAMGAAGAILAAANLIPHAYRAMYEAALRNDWETARSLQSRIYPIAAAVAGYGSLAVRAGLSYLGLAMGEPRLPLSNEATFTPSELERFHAALDDIQDV